MLLILLSLVCLTASFNSESVAEWYWDFIYRSKVNSARNLLKTGLRRAPSQLDRRMKYTSGDPISFKVPTENGLVPVSNYQPRPGEVAYVKRAFRGGSFVVYYNPLVPRQLVLEPTWRNAQSLLKKPKPARVPGDNMSRYLSLWGKILALVLFFFGITSVARNTSH